VNNGLFTKGMHVPGPEIIWYDLDLQEVGWHKLDWAGSG
jgi:hypothetical protein